MRSPSRRKTNGDRNRGTDDNDTKNRVGEAENHGRGGQENLVHVRTSIA